MTTTPEFSVVVCTRDRPNSLKRCLDALAVIDHSNYEVVVVDNSAGNYNVSRLAERAGARYVCEPRIGPSRARNSGARVAAGDFVAFIDDDAVPARDWLSRHAAALGDTSLSATTGRVLLSDSDSPAAEAFRAVGAFDLGPTPVRVDRTTPTWFELINFYGLGNGANLVFRRKLFTQGWGFREWLGHEATVMSEDHYAIFALVRDGHAVAYLPDAVVYHDPPTSLAELETRKRKTARGAAAYMTMLLVEEPGYRLLTMRYALQSLRGRPRPWREARPAAEPLLPRVELVRAVAGGPWQYLRARFRSKRV
jgi:glycosyltransferase involved in cell wall biosynthesis